MITQVRYTVRGPNGPAIEKAAADVLTEFVESPEIWRIAIESHKSEDDSEWIGHVTVRRKRTRSDDWDEF